MSDERQDVPQGADEPGSPAQGSGARGHSRPTRPASAPTDRNNSVLHLRGPALLDLKARWATLSPQQQLRARQAAIAVLVALFGYGLYSASNREEEARPQAPAASKLDMGAGLRGDSLETKVRGDLKKILDGQNLLGDRVTAIEEGKIGIGGTASHEPADGDLPNAMPGDIPAFPPSPSPSELDRADGSLSAPPMPSGPAAPPAPPVERQIGAIGAATSAVVAEGSSAPNGAKKKTRTIYLPPGFMKARLLTGIDALASRDATSNPEPLIARVQAPAVLPNDVKANLSGCFVIGNATGSLAKERVEVQLISLSCVDFDERSVIDQPIKGFFVDTDGKKGFRARSSPAPAPPLPAASSPARSPGSARASRIRSATPRPQRSAPFGPWMRATRSKPASPAGFPNPPTSSPISTSTSRARRAPSSKSAPPKMWWS